MCTCVSRSSHACACVLQVCSKLAISVSKALGEWFHCRGCEVEGWQGHYWYNLWSRFIKRQLWAKGYARVSPSQTGHKPASNIQIQIAQHMLRYATWPPEEILKVPLSPTGLHGTSQKISEEKAPPWLDQASWKKVWGQMTSCYPLALRDLGLAQQCCCLSILVSWSARENKNA